MMVELKEIDRSSRLSYRLIKASFLVIVLSMVSIATVYTLFSDKQAKEFLQRDIDVLASVLGNRSSAALVFGDVNAANKNLAAARFQDDVVKACLYDVEGNLFASYSVRLRSYPCEEKISSDYVTQSVEGGFLIVSKPVEDSDEQLGSILIQASTKSIEKTLFNALTTTALTFLIVIVIAFLILRRSVDSALIPLTSLYDTAVKIAKDPFSSLRAERMRSDEVGALVNVFNDMLDNLELENQAVQNSEQRFKALAKNSPVGIYQMNPKRELVYTNERWHELTSLPADLEGHEYQSYVEESDQELYLEVLAKVQETRKSQVVEYRFNAPDSGDKKIFMEHIAPVFHEQESGGEFAGFIGSLLDISDLKNAQMELENLAFYDPLTNLPNRRFFRDHLQYVVAAANHEENRIAILMLDLDNFKKVNDTLGHDAGDELLSALGERLRGQVAQKDVVSRMGGDEFMILLRDVDVRSSIQRIADRVLKSIKRPIKVRGHDIELSASIGIATYPEDAESAEELMRNADLALYLSKESGRNRLSFFSRKLETLVNEKVQMERKLRAAIKEDALTFYVQPQWCLRSGRLISLEVLMRWIDEEEGFISPDSFIPIAEEAGLILEMGDWLIDSVFESIANKRKEFEMLGIETVAINLSARQFFSNQLSVTIDEALKKYEIDPGMIELELTESAVMEDSNLAIRIMERLKNIGCRLSIDDFGTGYSSLSYLKKFPINSVKIDRSFISDIPQDQNDMEISSAIIAMGHNLGLQVVAEGVETMEQMNFLFDQGCDYAQGYFIAKPMPFDQLFTDVPDINLTIGEQVQNREFKHG